ncbi:MAG: amidohydrolase family protein [Phycisphaerales bacterium]|jgi:predicted TIM-barrel fold metal-dependent hydrolase|nr:amidohydrolase family protein [Phycisphaerales bacterium]
MTNPLLFDSWISYGPRPNKDPQERWALDHLLEDMDSFGIAAALVRHEQMACYDAMHVNARLTSEISHYRDRLVPCWTVLPHQGGDFPEPDELMRRMDDNEVRAAFFQPGWHHYPLHEDVLKPLAEVMNPRKMLILTTLEEFGGQYDSIKDFCRLFYNCAVLIGQASWNQWRLVTALMGTCPNIHLEFHLFQANRAVEYLASRYGADRLLFGSGLLRHSGGAARGFVDWSYLNMNDKAKFTHANLQRLLKSDAPLSPRMPSGADDYVQAAIAGQALPGNILDAHCHVLDDELDGGGGPYVMFQGDSYHMVQLAHDIGIKRTAMMSWNGPVCMDVEAGNALVEKVVHRHPQEIIGVSSCDPTHQTPEQIENMCRRLHLEKKFRGMKPYYKNGISYADPLYEPYWRFGDAYHLYALLHVSFAAGGMEAVRSLAREYPGLTILIAHSGGKWDFARQVTAVIGEFENVMAELTLTPVPNRIIEWMCGEVGSNRVLFGTDAPMRDPRPQLAWCVHTQLEAHDKTNILGGNFERILARARI